MEVRPFEMTGPTGVSAYRASGPIVGWEFNPDLTGAKKFNTFRAMTVDPTIAGLIALIESTIVSANVRFVGGRPDVLAFVNAQYPTDEIKRFLRQAMKHLWYGCYLFEIVPEMKDGMMVEKTYPRQPWTVIRWVVDDKKELTNVEQSSMNGYGNIPIDRLVLFSNEADGDNFEGISLLRSCYGPWKLKWDQRRLDILGAQRFAAGIPDIEMSDGAQAPQTAAAKLLAASLSSGDGAYIVRNPSDGIKSINILGGGGGARKPYDAEPKIEAYNSEMSRALLGQFMSFNAGSLGGAGELVSEMIERFYASIEMHAGAMARTAETQRYYRVIDWNFAGLGPQDYPKLEISGINRPDSVVLAKMLPSLLPLGIFNAQDFDMLKKSMGLTGYTPVTNTTEPENVETEANASTLHAGHRHTTKLSARPLTASEQRCNFARMTETMDTGVASIKSEASKIKTEMLALYARFLIPLVKARDLEGISKLEPRFIDKLSKLFGKTAGLLFDEGGAEVRSELQGAVKLAGRAGPLTLRISVIDNAEDNADTVARATADAARKAARRAVQAGIEDDDEILDAIEKAAGSVADAMIAKSALNIAAEAFTNGRDAEAQGYDVKKTTYSAIMDSGTCDACAEADEQEVIDGEPAAPNPDCASNESGLNNCRCIWVYDV